MRISDWSSDVCSSDLAAFPGLADAFAQMAVDATVCAPDAVQRGVLRHFDAIRSDSAAPAFVTRLTRLETAPVMVDSREPVAVAATPSHALSGWRASALSAQPLPRDADRKRVVEGKSVYVRVDQGGGRIIKKKQKNTKTT